MPVTIGQNKTNGELVLDEFRRQSELIDLIREQLLGLCANVDAFRHDSLEVQRDGLEGVKDGLEEVDGALRTVRQETIAQLASVDGHVLALAEEVRDRFKRMYQQVDTTCTLLHSEQKFLENKLIELRNSLGGVEERLHEEQRELGQRILDNFDSVKKRIDHVTSVVGWTMFVQLLLGLGGLLWLAKLA